MENTSSTQKTEWVALLGFLVSFVFAILVFLLSYWTDSRAVWIEGWHFLVGMFLWFLIFLHSQQKRLAWEEELFEQKTVPSNEKTIFSQEEQDPFTARSRFKFFEKWIITIATLFLGIGLLLLCFFCFRKTWYAEPLQIRNASLASAFLVGFAFFSLLIAKYTLGMAKQNIWRLLQAGGSYLLMNAIMSFLCGVAMALTAMEIPTVEYYLTYVISILFGIIGFELLLNLLLDFYRPRISTQEVHPPYHSRFLEICTGSAGLLKTAAQTLDYQFGFKVSETWFYRFLEKAIAPLILFQMLVLYLLTCIVVVSPQNQAILERFGTPVSMQPLEPGLHFKLPWPFEKAYYFPVQALQRIHIGVMHNDEDNEDHHQEHKQHDHGEKSSKNPKIKKAILFTKDHGHGAEEFFITVAKPSATNVGQEVPVDLLMLDVFLDYRIVDVMAYSYGHADSLGFIESIAYQEITLLLTHTQLEDLMGAKRLELCDILQQKIQAHCTQKNLGVQITLLGIQNLHVPPEIALDFEAVLSAMEEKQTKIYSAEKYRLEILPIAQAKAQEIILSAKKYATEKQLFSTAESDTFSQYCQAYQAGGELYLSRKYLKILEDNLANKRAYIIDLPRTSKEVDILNLEDKLSSDLLQLDLNQTEEKKP